MNNTFPKALTALPNWVCWRLEKVKNRGCKVPYNPRTGGKAMPNKPETWATFAEAVDAMQKYGFLGIGFMFTLESGIVGVDIDKCICPQSGVLNEIAFDILEKLQPTYIEVSPSGTGLHIFLKGTLPSGGKRNSKTGVEMYSTARYFTMTGVRYKDCVDKIVEDNAAIEWILETYIKTRTTKKKSEKFAVGFSGLSDDKLLEMALNAKDGATFTALWDGNWQGHKSQSEADFALCCKLIWWSNHNVEQVDRLFRQSGLMRDKWNGEYGHRTIRKASEVTPDGYAPPKPKNMNIFTQHGGYWRMKGDNSYPLTNFEIEPESIVQGEKETQLTCVFVSDSGKKYRQTFFAEDLCTLNRFKKVLTAQGIELCFFGTDRDLEVFRDYIRNMDWKHKLGVKTLGIHKHNGRLLYVNPETAVAADGSVDDTIVQLEHHKEVESDILKHQPLTEKSDLYFIGENALSYNEYAKTVSVLGWTAACFIKGHLWALGAKFPHLILVGEGGSGKSTTYEKFISPIFSLNEKADEASQMTAFTLMLASASSNVIPQVIEEFKPSKIGERITNWHYNHFRSVYDRHHGKADHAVAFINQLCHTKSDWAGKSFILV